MSARLRGLFSPSLEPFRARHRDELEGQLLERFEQRRTVESGPRRVPWVLKRVAVAVALGAATASACRMPVGYELELGERLAVMLPAAAKDTLDLPGMAAFIERSFEMEELSMEVRVEQRLGVQGHEDATAGTLRLEWGWVGQTDADEVWTALATAFPVVATARIEAEPLESRVEGTLGGFLTHEVLDVVIDERGVEAAKGLIIEELAARGVDGSASVEVERAADGERTRVEVRVESDFVP
ncbi:MAG: hypothetical protein B7733_08580 [Myxococcales bacterium FL481]|nr:MAG: hypothetical protein B7733_08580 [Myxococcales bacterium FL481]